MLKIMSKRQAILLRVWWFLSSLLVPSAFAQDHTHDASAMKKPNTCESTGIECANAATAFIAKDGVVWLTWTSGGQVSVAKSLDFGKTFLPPKALAQHGKALDTGGDARPQLVVTDAGKVVIAYAFFKDSQWNAQINTVQSSDGGETFSIPKSIVKDTSSQRFPVLQLMNGNDVFMAWIDKRYVTASKNTSKPLLGGSIAYGWLNAEGIVPNNEVIANRSSCECCRIGVALSPTKLPVLAYRAIFDGKVRDHALQVIAADKSPGLVRKIAVDDWQTDICPHQGPSVSLSEKGTIHTTWYSQGNERKGIFYAQSSDEGATFTPPRRLGDENSNSSRAYVMSLDQQLWVIWKEFDGQNATVVGEYSGDHGKTWQPKKILAKTAGYSDHPLLITYQHRIYLSWLTRNSGYQLIQLEAK